jgi:hypothetical protein
MNLVVFQIPNPPSLVPGLPEYKPPRIKLPVPFKHSAEIQADAGAALQTAYQLGGLNGFTIGHQIGHATARPLAMAEGVVIGSVVTAVSILGLFLCGCVLMRMLRK